MSEVLIIVVIEVHAALLDVTVRLLRLHGHAVQGISALSEATAERLPAQIDLLVLGWHAPDCQLVLFLREFRATHPGAFVVATTANGHLPGAIAAEVDTWLTLPSGAAELLAIVAARVASREPDTM